MSETAKDENERLAILTHRPSAIVRARQQAHRSVEPVWTEPIISETKQVSEPVRGDALAISLRLEQLVGSDSATIAMTGLESSSGVSTAALEISRAFACARAEPTLLVDANLRHPSLAQRIGAPPRPGLAEVVRGEAHIDDAVHQVGPDSLYVLPAGIAEEETPTILASSACIGLFRSLRLQFGHIIVDTAPIGKYVDAAFVAAQAQCVALFVKQGKHQRSEVRSVLHELSAIGVTGVGLCLSRGAQADVMTSAEGESQPRSSS